MWNHAIDFLCDTHQVSKWFEGFCISYLCHKSVICGKGVYAFKYIKAGRVFLAYLRFVTRKQLALAFEGSSYVRIGVGQEINGCVIVIKENPSDVPAGCDCRTCQRLVVLVCIIWSIYKNNVR